MAQIVQTLILLLPFLLAGSSALLTLRLLRTPALRRTGLVGLGLTGLAVGLDAALLALLPALGISYGPFGLPLVVLAVVRMMLYCTWAFLLCRRRSPPAQGWGVPSSLLCVQGLVLVLAIEAFAVEPQLLTTTELQIQAPLAAPLRIVHLSDMHIERLTHREQAVMAQVQALQPDLILMTGDYLNLSYLEDPQALRDARIVFAGLQARYGIYAVNGSVDDAARMERLFAGTSVQVLDDQRTRLELAEGTIDLLGVTDLSFERDCAALDRLLASSPPGVFTILLHHTPDLIEHAAAGDIDLYLAGHTHGGQIRAPLYGAIVTFSRYGKQYEAGRYQVGPTTLYVSRGLGMEGALAPRARFLSPPEIELITLSPGVP